MRSVKCIAILAVIFNSSVLATTDGGDGTFGKNGRIVEMLSSNAKASFSSIALLPSGKIVAGGNAYNIDNYSVITLYGYLRNGMRDRKWNHGNPLIIDYVDDENDFPEGRDFLNSLLLQGKKNILIGATLGKIEGDNKQRGFIGLSRYGLSGEKDLDFGSNEGWALKSMGKHRSHMIKAIVAPDKKIYTLGMYHTPGSKKTPCITTVCRFTKDGKVDQTYGKKGCAEYYDDSLPTQCETPEDFLMQPDGKIVIVGEGFEKGCGGSSDFLYERGFAVRLESNGTVDRSFANNGILKMTASSIFDPNNQCSGSVFKSLALQKDGKIVIMGNGKTIHYDFFLTRITKDGKIDKKFGFDGVVAMIGYLNYWEWKGMETNFREVVWPMSYYGERVLVDTNDNIIVTGSAQHSREGYMEYSANFFAAKYTKDGRRDWSYGTGGISKANIYYKDSFLGSFDASAAALQKDGKILIGGWLKDGEGDKHAWLVRLKKYFRAKSYDGKMGSDLLWRKRNGNYEIWYMNNQGKKQDKRVFPGKNLDYKASGDFNGDGISDIIWQDRKNKNKIKIWYFINDKGEKKVKILNIKGMSFVASGDFNGDGTDDIIMKKGKNYRIWFMGKNGKISYHNLPSSDEKVFATGDFNGDHVSDILAKTKDGIYTIWYMRNDGEILYKKPIKLWSNYLFGGIGDFDGDGSDDILWKMDDINAWSVWVGGNFAVYALDGDDNGDMPAGVGDYNGDGFADIIWKDKNKKGKYTIWELTPWSDDEDIDIKKKIKINAGNLHLVN